MGWAYDVKGRGQRKQKGKRREKQVSETKSTYNIISFWCVCLHPFKNSGKTKDSIRCTTYDSVEGHGTLLGKMKLITIVKMLMSRT